MYNRTPAMLCELTIEGEGPVSTAPVESKWRSDVRPDIDAVIMIESPTSGMILAGNIMVYRWT